MAKIRRPTQAGSFYEGDAERLRAQIENCYLQDFGPGKIPKVDKTGPRKIVGLVCPHAGYMFSGSIAANAYYELALDGKPQTIVILGPNHTGLGSPLAVMNEGYWRTPLGDVEVDRQTANQIAHESRIIDIDSSAHLEEHSVEVQLPFLQYLYGDEFKLVPICFLMQDFQSATEVGKALAETLANKNAVIIASSDFTHYQPQETANKKDMMALKAIEAMDEKLFYSTIQTQRISACGYGPITALLTAAKGLGAQEAKLLCYKTSGDITGDYASVVGYAAFSLKTQKTRQKPTSC